jgi:acyl-CoA thioesterase-1
MMSTMKKIILTILTPLAFLLVLAASMYVGRERIISKQKVSEPPPAQGTVILAFGDSLTAGYGLPYADSYPAQLERHLRDRNISVSVLNSGISGDTTAGGARRIAWVLENGKPSIVLVGLGGNDALRATDPGETERNLRAIVKEIKDFGATPVLLGMRAPQNLGKAYRDQFDSLYARIAQEESIPLVPFMLDGIALVPELNLPDGIHPTRNGYELMVNQNIMPVLSPLLPGSE